MDYLNTFNAWVMEEESEWVPNENVWKCVYYFLLVQFLGLSPTIFPAFILIMEIYREETTNLLFGITDRFPTLVIAAAAVSCYWINGFLWLAWDFYAPEWVQKKYLVQPKRQITKATIWKVIKNLLLNQIFTVIPLCLMYDIFLVQKGLGIRIEDYKSFPSYFRLVKEVLLIAIGEILIFTYGHLLLHTKTFYKMHKTHHELKQPFALGAAYCHPFENLISNFVPFSAPAMLFRVHPFSQLFMALIAVLGTQLHHSGWSLPWYSFMEQPEYHDKHHELFIVNLGVTGLLDWIHGTGADSINKEPSGKSIFRSNFENPNKQSKKMSKKKN